MDETTLLAAWQARARRSSSAHYQLAVRYALINGFLTIVVIALAAFVGSSVFAKLQDQAQWRWVLGGLSVAAAVITGIQRTLGLSELAERHRAAGAGWDKLFNDMTLACARPQATAQTLDHAKQAMASLVDRSPYIPQAMFERLKIDEAYNRVLGRG